MKYGSSTFRTWLALLLLAFSCVCLRAQTATGSGSYNGASYEGSISATASGSAVNFVYSMTINGSQLAGVYIYSVNTDGNPVADPLFYDRQASSFSGTHTVPLPLTPPAVGLKMFVYGQDTATDPSGSNNKIGERVTVSLVSVPQVVSVSPTSQAIQKGNAALLAASGALGGNSYVWTTSGGSLTTDGDEASLFSATSGTYTVSVYAQAGNGYPASSVVTATVTFTDGLPQNVSISPATATVNIGDTTDFTAFGGQNGYSWSLSGGGVVSYSGSVGKVIWNTGGSYIVKVWSPAGGDYDRSNEATARVIVQGGEGFKNKVTLSFDNRERNYAVVFTVWQDGKPVTSVTVPAGVLLVKTIAVPTSSAVTVTVKLNDAGSDVFNEENQKEQLVGEYSPTDTSGGSSPPVESAKPPDPDEPQPMPEEPAEQDNENPYGSPNLQTEISSANRAHINAAMNAGLSAGAKGREQANKAIAEFGDVGSTQIQSVQQADTGSISLGTHGGKALSLPRSPFSAGGPFSGVMSTVAAFVKRLIAWGIVVTFFLYVMGEVRSMVRAPFQTASTASSLTDSLNSIKIFGIGGGWGYVVRVAIMITMLSILLTIPVAVFATVTSGLPWADLVNVFESGPAVVAGNAAGNMLNAAIAITNQVIPWGMLMAAPLWWVFVRFVLFPSEFFWLLFMKLLPT